MNQSENIADLAAALSKAQGEIKSATKDSINPHFKNKYASLGSCWDACREPLTKNSLAIIQQIETINSELVMTTTLVHTSGQWMKSHVPLIIVKKDMQGLGAAATYARRYGLSAIVGIDGDEDDDGEIAAGRNNSKSSQLHENTTKVKKNMCENNTKVSQDHIVDSNEKIQNSSKISQDQYEQLLEMIKQADDICVTNMCSYLSKTFSVDDYKDMPKEAFKGCMAGLNNNIEMNKKKMAVA